LSGGIADKGLNAGPDAEHPVIKAATTKDDITLLELTTSIVYPHWFLLMKLR
jgi:hypothetical protein